LASCSVATTGGINTKTVLTTLVVAYTKPEVLRRTLLVRCNSLFVTADFMCRNLSD